MSVPAWIDADGDLPERELDGGPSGTFDNNFPLTVCVREWQCERSKTSFIRKKKSAHVRIELKRKPTRGIGLHGYRDLENGSAVGSKGWADIIEREDTVLFHLLKSSRFESSTAVISGDSSVTSASVSTMGFRGADDFNNKPPDMRDKWKLKVSVPISNVSLKLDNSKVVATFSAGNSTKTNILHFSSFEEALSFVTFVKETKNALKKINESAIRGEIGTETTPSGPLKFLIEIISATDLKAADRTTSDPFVVVKFGGKKIHTTSAIKKTLDPIWTLRTGSLFIFALNPEELYNHDLLFEIKDMEGIVAGMTLGQCLLSPSKLIKQQGDRLEMKLRYLQVDKDAQGALAIRCRRATASDIDFVNRAKSNSLIDKKYFRDFVAPTLGKQRAPRSIRRKKTENGVSYHLARPIDENNGPVWMTSTEIEDASRDKSLRWMEVGSGDVGHLYVEVIGCDDLVDKDRDSLLGGKTDAFVTMVFEDSIVTTDIVSDCLNPRFLPWTKRAFKFNMSGMSSPIYIGVFDHDVQPVDHHDPIGRITIPMQKFVPNTTYMLSYDLFNTNEIGNRRSDGSITLRIRLELNRGQRGLFFNVQSSRSENFIHLDNKKNYSHAHYTVRGDYDVTRYDMKSFLSLIEELLEYQNIIFYIRDALKTLLLWRAHYPLNLLCCRIWLPLHSMVMFSFAIVIAEFPEYIPSLFFASIAWFMLALLELERKRPNPWDRPPSYGSLLLRFITNRARPETIAEFQDSDADREYMRMLMVRTESYKYEMDQMLKELNAEAELQEQMESQRKERASKQKRKRLPKIQIFKGILEPIYVAILPLVLQIRGVKSVLRWDRFYVAFWITTISALCTLLTVGLIYFYKDMILDVTILWAKRIVLYGTLSPLNKILDQVYYRKFDTMTEREREELHKKRLRHKRNRFRGEYLQRQLKLENHLKEQAFKTMMYGPNLLPVPSIDTPERFDSIPLPKSYAMPSKFKAEDELTTSTLVCSLHGQT